MKGVYEAVIFIKILDIYFLFPPQHQAEEEKENKFQGF
jgi:hypothetical protein